MSHPPATWAKLGRIAARDRSRWWMVEGSGPACAISSTDPSRVEIYLSGRDERGRSHIGRGWLDLSGAEPLLSIEPEPVLSPGELGAFDENGVSYPCAVRIGDQVRIYYVGWMLTVLTPFQNHVGLAEADAAGRFARVSRAPVLPRTDADYLAIGSCWVTGDGEGWRMWYTAFTGWGGGDAPHHYVIKTASSANGVDWDRPDVVCISPTQPDEHSISRPTVLVVDDVLHMWFCYRGDRYRIGYAHSTDGEVWVRNDDNAGIACSPTGWDSQELCYPAVFTAGDDTFLLYCGNNYGRDGVGVARLESG